MQNNKKYWLRVGTVLAILHVIPWIVLFLINPPYSFNFLPPLEWFNFAFIIDAPVAYIGSFLFEHTNIIPHNFVGTSYWLLFAGAIQWFVVGSIIGWLYGKIKNRRKIN